MWRTSITRLCEGLAVHLSRSPHTISTRLTGSGDMYARLQRGCDITTRRVERILQRASDQWPTDLPWPADIPRPAPTPGSPAAEAAASPPEPSDHDRRLAAALELSPKGRIRSPASLCQALGVSRTVYDDVVKRYRDTGPLADSEPQRGTWTQRVLVALVESGDVRFEARRERRRKTAEVARKFGFTGPAA